MLFCSSLIATAEAFARFVLCIGLAAIRSRFARAEPHVW
jgi:hypothetical protein